MSEERDIVERLQSTPEIVLSEQDQMISDLCDEAAEYIAKLREFNAALVSLAAAEKEMTDEQS